MIRPFSGAYVSRYRVLTAQINDLNTFLTDIKDIAASIYGDGTGWDDEKTEGFTKLLIARDKAADVIRYISLSLDITIEEKK